MFSFHKYNIAYPIIQNHIREFWQIFFQIDKSLFEVCGIHFRTINMNIAQVS